MSIRLALSSVLLLALTGCSVSNNSVPGCQSGEVMQQSTLYFGLNRPHGEAITRTEWQNFLNDDVTPRFREGLTVFTAYGQWLGSNGQVAREESNALMLIHRADRKSDRDIEALRTIYKTRFMQESVMRVDNSVCVAF